MKRLAGLMRGRTSFVIAHRLSTLDVCDARLELERRPDRRRQRPGRRASRAAVSDVRPLRIAVLARVAMAVQPREGESIEQLVFLLTEELVRRGHAVTLFATGNSETSADLRWLYSRGYTEDASIWDWRLAEAMHAARAFEQAEEFDLIHSHAHHFALPFTRLVPTPVITTYHVEVDKDIVGVFARHPEAGLVAVSEWQRSTLAGIAQVPVIPHGIDVNAFPFAPDPGDYLLYLGRMIPDKGPVDAIRIAEQAGLPIVLAGPGASTSPRRWSRWWMASGCATPDGSDPRTATGCSPERQRSCFREPVPGAVRPRDGGGHGLRHAGGGDGGGGRARDRGAGRHRSCGRDGGGPGGARRPHPGARSPSRARARGGALRYARMVDDYEALYADTVARRGAAAS